MSSKDLQSAGGLEGGALEREIIANIIGGYEQWKAEQGVASTTELEGGRRRRRRGGRAGGATEDVEETAQEQGLEGGKTQEIEGGEEEELEGGKKRGRPCKKRRTLKLKSCGRMRRFVCSPKKYSKKGSKKRSKKSRSRKSTSWSKRVGAYARKHGVSAAVAAHKLSK